MKKYLGTILLMVFMAPATFAQPQLPTAYEMYSIGIDYLKGINGKPMNYESAMNWFQAAAEQGYDYARTMIGLMYENGCQIVELLFSNWISVSYLLTRKKKVTL